MGLFQFLFKTGGTTPAKAKPSKAFLARLPSLASGISQGADSIYRQLLIEQFKDYEERYGCTLVGQINDAKKSALTRVVVSFMLYTFCNKIVESYPEEPSLPLTSALHFKIYKEKPIAGSFMDYITYQNPNFEDRKLAPAFKFGNEIAQIMETMDMAFSFMASQQAILIAEITRKILDGLLEKAV